jgi:hypothetical protein
MYYKVQSDIYFIFNGLCFFGAAGTDLFDILGIKEFLQIRIKKFYTPVGTTEKSIRKVTGQFMLCYKRVADTAFIA